jgi:hypothetical protein
MGSVVVAVAYVSNESPSICEFCGNGWIYPSAFNR